MGRHFTKEEQKEWLKSQPRKPLSSKLLLVDEAGRLFFTRPTYKPGWGLVGGMVDENESPLEAVLREAAEETGITLAAERLVFLGVRYGVSKNSGDDYLHFLFKAQLTHDEAESIHVQENEIEDSCWLPAAEIDEKIDVQDHTWVLAKQAMDKSLPFYSDKDEVVISPITRSS
jgi:8-oxo-dGTP pyrophosphatase MutT (NUDIX family)